MYVRLTKHADWELRGVHLVLNDRLRDDPDVVLAGDLVLPGIGEDLNGLLSSRVEEHHSWLGVHQVHQVGGLSHLDRVEDGEPAKETEIEDSIRELHSTNGSFKGVHGVKWVITKGWSLFSGSWGGSSLRRRGKLYVPIRCSTTPREVCVFRRFEWEARLLPGSYKCEPTAASVASSASNDHMRLLTKSSRVEVDQDIEKRKRNWVGHVDQCWAKITNMFSLIVQIWCQELKVISYCLLRQEKIIYHNIR